MLVDALPVAAHLARASRGLGEQEDGWVLAYHPVARMNPYQALLYSRAKSHGFAPVGLINASDFDALEVPLAFGVNTVLHLHWTSGVLSVADDEDSAVASADRYIEKLAKLKGIGVRLVWSVHNVLPHQCEYPDVEAQLRSRLANLVDAIHVMAENTVDAVRSNYRLPEEKIFEVPHPSYIGAYPNFIEPTTARFELGYERSDFIVGSVGSIQPYKGLSRFAEAARDHAQADPAFKALIAGIPGRDDQSKSLIAELQAATHIDLVARRLNDSEIATVVTALDFMVLPYRASLNSGAALLALSFGAPILAPNHDAFAPLISRGFGVGYEAEQPDGLRRGLEDAKGFRASFDVESALEYAASLAGPEVSSMFFRELRIRLMKGH